MGTGLLKGDRKMKTKVLISAALIAAIFSAMPMSSLAMPVSTPQVLGFQIAGPTNFAQQLATIELSSTAVCTEENCSIEEQIEELTAWCSGQKDMSVEECVAKGIDFINGVHAGTIGTTVGGSIEGFVIQKMTDSPGQLSGSHSLIGVGEGVFVEAYPDGVAQIRAVDVYIRANEKKMEARLQEVPGITVEQRLEAASFANSHVGDEYSVLGAIFGIPEPDKWYCSELAYKALKHAGIDLDTAFNVTGQTLGAGLGIVVGVAVDAANVSPQELTNAKVSGNKMALTFSLRSYKYTPKEHPSGENLVAPTLRGTKLKGSSVSY